MNRIPQALVRFQQATMVTVLVFALLLQQPWLVAALFAVVLLGLVGGPGLNLLFLAGRPLVQRYIDNERWEDADAQRFNQMIATAMLGLGSALLLGANSSWGWLFAGMVLVAASLALAGFCIGCVLYLRIRFLRHRLFGAN